MDYQAAEVADEYYRFQEEAVTVELDDASPDTIQRLLAAADDIISRNDSTLTALAEVLKENVSPIAVREDARRPLATTSRVPTPDETGVPPLR